MLTRLSSVAVAYAAEKLSVSGTLITFVVLVAFAVFALELPLVATGRAVIYRLLDCLRPKCGNEADGEKRCY